MFSDQIAKAIIASAQNNQIEPACLLALVEIETGGKAFEQDGSTPQLLYERHVAYREAGKAGCRDSFVRAGLAIPHWDKATQYRDERTSAMRLDLIERARAINEEVADRSCSWGLGQTMGFLAEELHFPSARDMVAHQTGSIEGQLDCMIGELRKSHLIEPLNNHDWPHVARVYNGSGYRANQYDTKLADAWKRWSRKVATVSTRPAPPEDELTPEAVKSVQRSLRMLGYYEVGTADGVWGSRTTGALSAFQAHEGLAVTGHFDEATKAALAEAEARPVAKERATVTRDDLPDSRTIAHAQSLSLWGRVTQFLGFGGAVTAGADKAGLLDQIGEWRGYLEQVTDIWDWVAGKWWLIAIVVGFVIAYGAEKIIEARVEDHQTGKHAGSEEE